MELSAQYARALFDIKNPDAARTLEALKRRGHLKLLPRILNEYEKLQLAQARRDEASRTTPQQERTRILLELYRKLTAN